MQQTHSEDEEEGYQSDSAMQQVNDDQSMEDASSWRPSSASVRERQQLTRAAKAAAAGDASPAAGGAATAGNAEKRSRYLREIDRRNIIHRIDRGEKQSALAKEFGVTRAAICHINKNRVEILTRSNRADVHSNARHPKRGMYSSMAVTASASVLSSSAQHRDEAAPPPTVAAPAPVNQPSVLEMRSQAMALLMTKLRGRETESRDFHLCADRAF
ncbi:Uracil phosphoribosyltransferase, partial [Globisporangium polare]